MDDNEFGLSENESDWWTREIERYERERPLSRAEDQVRRLAWAFEKAVEAVKALRSEIATTKRIEEERRVAEMERGRE